MIFAFFRLFTIAFGSIVGLALVIFGLRVMGSKQVYTVPPHPLLNIHPFIVAWGGDSSQGAAPFTLPAYKQAANEQYVLGVLVHVSQDGVWFVAPSNKLSELHLGHGFLTQTPSTSLARVLRFNDLIHALPRANYYVKIDNPATPKLTQFFKAIESANLAEHFVLTTPFADAAKMIRQRNPNWLVGATTSQVAKSRVMSSIYLEPTMSLNAEEFTLPIEPIDLRLLKELKKRQILTLVERHSATPTAQYAKDVQTLLSQKRISGAIYDSNQLPKFGASLCK